MDSYDQHPYYIDEDSEQVEEERFSEVSHLIERLDPEHHPAFTTSFMNPTAATKQVAEPANPPPWEDPQHAWRYVEGDYVWTGEAFVWAPRPRPQPRPVPDTTVVQVPARAPVPTSPNALPVPTFPDAFPVPTPFPIIDLRNNNRSVNSPTTRPPPPRVFIPERKQSTEFQYSGVISGHPRSHDLMSLRLDSPSLDSHVSSQASTPAVDSDTDFASPGPRDHMATPTSVRDIDEWSDKDILLLYKWKRVMRKGNTVVLRQFPGETELSIAAAWKQYRARGQRLWEASGSASGKKRRSTSRGTSVQKVVKYETDV